MSALAAPPRGYVGRGNYRLDFTPAEQKQIVTAYTDGGQTSQQIADRMAVSRSTIDRVLTANRVVKRPRGPQPCRSMR